MAIAVMESKRGFHIRSMQLDCRSCAPADVAAVLFACLPVSVYVGCITLHTTANLQSNIVY